MENLRIGIIGNIGAGKSTLVDSASKEPLSNILLSALPKSDQKRKVCAFQEEFNPKVLEAFYEDPVANAFMAQIEFFNGRLDRQKKVANCHGIVLEDRTLQEDYHIFGLAQKILGHMSEAEFEAYQRTYGLMTEKIPEPHLIVYLKADVDTLHRRLRLRGRDAEAEIPKSYLKLLNELYEEFVERHVKCPVIVINANDHENMETYLRNTVNKIAETIKNLKLRIVTPGISEWVNLPQTAATLKAIDSEKKLEKFLADNPKLISIAGNVGLGKSTLAAIMERSLKIGGLYENPEDNPLLEKFLADKKTYCYDLQRHFLEMRAKQQIEGKQNKSYVMDRSLPEDLLVFCHQFHKDGHLTSDQLDDLTVRFKAKCNDIPSADLIIVLTGRASFAWQRIQERGREMEIQGGWTLSEIEALNHWYESYSTDVTRFGYHRGKVLEIDVEKLDITNRIHAGYIFEEIYRILSE